MVGVSAWNNFTSHVVDERDKNVMALMPEARRSMRAGMPSPHFPSTPGLSNLVKIHTNPTSTPSPITTTFTVAMAPTTVKTYVQYYTCAG